LPSASLYSGTGTAHFKTSVDVTGELSPQAAALAMHRLICIYALSRMNPDSLKQACQSLVDIYVWQTEQQSYQGISHISVPLERLPANPIVKQRARRQFQIEE
jgi:hypothetical protein